MTRSPLRSFRNTLRVALVLALFAPGLAGAEPDGVLNVNTATAEQLEMLPGIGEAKARAILETREARGGFKSVDELLEVRGIGEAALDKIRPHVSVKGRSTLSVQ